MKINIQELKKKSEVTFKGKQQISLRGINPMHKVQVCDADVEGVLTKVENRYIVEGQVSVIVKRLCDRCSPLRKRHSCNPQKQSEKPSNPR